MIGTTLGHYQVTSQLGKAAWGRYFGRRPETGTGCGN